MGKKSLDNCKSGKDFLAYAETRDANIRNGKGSHFVVQTDNGSCVVPYHGNEQLGCGLRKVIIKTFIAIGLGLFIMVCYYNPDLCSQFLQWLEML